MMLVSLGVLSEFLSTPSARKATQGVDQQRGAAFISIHALREEGDCFRLVMMTVPLVFLSTPSARKATPTPAS